jgi:recombinational DNA repair ATPase RecF
MELVKVYFDAFKSLLAKELRISQKCLGIVGTNESGKSNLLYAINVLGGNTRLDVADVPKMSRGSNPTLRFEFSLTTNG